MPRDPLAALAGAQSGVRRVNDRRKVPAPPSPTPSLSQAVSGGVVAEAGTPEPGDATYKGVSVNKIQ